MSNLATIEPRPSLTAGARPTAIVPTDMESTYRLATAICRAGMAPKGLETPEKAMVAIMLGMEVGLTPFAALQRIAVVNGRPTIWGDGAIGLVRGSGLCEYVTETVAGAGDDQTATCKAKRRGEPDPIVRTFSVADAKRAGLWGKSGPWQQFPQRMLQMRARAFALRDGFADVLGGVYVREEVEDEAEAIPVRRAPPPPPAIAAPVQTAPAPQQTRRPPPPPAERSSAPYAGPAPAQPIDDGIPEHLTGEDPQSTETWGDADPETGEVSATGDEMSPIEQAVLDEARGKAMEGSKRLRLWMARQPERVQEFLARFKDELDRAASVADEAAAQADGGRG